MVDTCWNAQQHGNEWHGKELLFIGNGNVFHGLQRNGDGAELQKYDGEKYEDGKLGQD